MTCTGVIPIARSRPIWRRWASTRPPIAVASVKAAASSASTVVVWRIVSSRRDSSVSSLRCVRQSSVRTVPAGGEPAAAARERLRLGRLAEAEADAELQRLLGGGEPEHVGRVGPAAVGRARARADADHDELAPDGSAAGHDRVADVDAVTARELALQHDLARRAPGATVEDQGTLHARPRGREPDQPERVALAAEAHRGADERPRALGGRDAGQRGDAGEGIARTRERGHVRAVRRLNRRS